MTSNPLGLDTVGSGQTFENTRVVQSRATKRSPEFVISEVPRPGEPVTALFDRIADRLSARKAEVVSVMLFGSLGARDEINRAMRETLGEIAWPLTWVEGASCDGAALAGVQVFAISGRAVTRVRLGNRIVASVYEDGDARHCLLGGVGPTSVAMRAPAQVQQMFGNLESALDLAGFELSDVVRTWFYNDDILSWYDEFNRVRSAHYAGVKWRTGSIPASTGVEGRNPAGAALAVAAWAVRPLDAATCAREIGSPLQCPAPNYGSSFSRAMEIQSGGWRRLLISGTASIHPDGKTAFIGNAKKQVDLTMDVVGAILRSRGMGFEHVTRALGYFEHPQFKPYFEAWCAERQLADFPVVPVHCDICRDDLLFELELDATVATS
jgi:enamine deaminase RidA (YjgF/YER057c/UK114 family)